MIEVQNLDRWHLENIEVQDSQVDAFLEDHFDSFYLKGPGFAAVEDGVVLAVFALYPVDHEGRYIAFTVLARNLGSRRLLGIARRARAWLEEWGDYRRVEAYCMEDAVDELRWCRYALGMELEGKLRAFTPDGRDAYLFAKV